MHSSWGRYGLLWTAPVVGNDAAVNNSWTTGRRMLWTTPGAGRSMLWTAPGAGKRLLWTVPGNPAPVKYTSCRQVLVLQTNDGDRIHPAGGGLLCTV